MLTITRRFINPVTRQWAGARHSPFAMLYHVGRKSGKAYSTPVIVRRVPDGFLFAPTYGPEVDWYRNVMAARRCELKWHGTLYALQQPESVDAEQAVATFPPLLQPILRTRHVTHFFIMHDAPTTPATHHSAAV